MKAEQMEKIERRDGTHRDATAFGEEKMRTWWKAGGNSQAKGQAESGEGEDVFLMRCRSKGPSVRGEVLCSAAHVTAVFDPQTGTAGAQTHKRVSTFSGDSDGSHVPMCST